MRSPEIDILQSNLNKWNLIQDEQMLLQRQDYGNDVKLIKHPKVDKMDPTQLEDNEYNISGDFSFSNTKNQSSSYHAPRENEISADIYAKNIIHVKRTRKPKTSAAIYVEPTEDYGIEPGLPFFSCLVNAITTDRLDEKIKRFDNSNDVCHSESDCKTLPKINDPSSWKQIQKHPDRAKLMSTAY